jgi:hypothetical protein
MVISMPSLSAVTAYDVRGTTLLCVPEFLTPATPHRVRDIRANWDTLVTQMYVGREIRHLKCNKDGAQGEGLVVTLPISL